MQRYAHHLLAHLPSTSVPPSRLPRPSFPHEARFSSASAALYPVTLKSLSLTCTPLLGCRVLPARHHYSARSRRVLECRGCVIFRHTSAPVLTWHPSPGHCYLMQDDLQKAYAAYQQALYWLPNPKDDPKLWYGIGILYDRYGSLDHAEEAFASVLRMDRGEHRRSHPPGPKFAHAAFADFDKANEILFRLGIIYKQQGKYPQSLDVRSLAFVGLPWLVLKPMSAVFRAHITQPTKSTCACRHLVSDGTCVRAAERCKSCTP